MSLAPNTKEQEGDVNAEISSSDGWSIAFFCWYAFAQLSASSVRVRGAHGGCAREFAGGRSGRCLWRRNRTYRRWTTGSNRRRRCRRRVGTPVLGPSKQSALLLDRQFLLSALPILQWTMASLLSEPAPRSTCVCRSSRWPLRSCCSALRIGVSVCPKTVGSQLCQSGDACSLLGAQRANLLETIALQFTGSAKLSVWCFCLCRRSHGVCSPVG